MPEPASKYRVPRKVWHSEKYNLKQIRKNIPMIRRLLDMEECNVGDDLKCVTRNTINKLEASLPKEGGDE